MTQMIDLSAAQLEKKLGRVVSSLELVVAKNLALGVDRSQLCDILGNGITVGEIQELQETPEFQELYSAISTYLLEQSADTHIGWDELEAHSLRMLMKEARNNRDPEFQLRLAATANKAVRRHTQGARVLDPGSAGTRVQISLSQRFIKKLNGETEISERRIDVTRMTNPSLEAVQRTLNVIPELAAAGTQGPELSPPDVIQGRTLKVPAPGELNGESALAAVLKSMVARA